MPARAATLGAQGLDRLKSIQARHPHLLADVRGAGMLFALQFQPLIPISWARSQSELVGELSGVLGLELLHNAGVEACLALNAKSNVRLTPALNMPEDLLGDLWKRVERAAAESPSAWRVLVHTRFHILRDLARFSQRT